MPEYLKVLQCEEVAKYPFVASVLNVHLSQCRKES
jgi:hypothetical protein